jgi:acetyl esterase/lipase
MSGKRTGTPTRWPWGLWFDNESHSMRILWTGVLIVICFVASRASAQVAKEPTQRFLDWDKNKDGKLTRDELPPAMQLNFEKVDLNKDGSISPEEDAQVPGGRLDGVKVDRNVPYAADDNPRHTLDLYRPKYPRSKKMPVIAFIHGGGWQRGSKRGGGRFVIPFVSSQQFVGVSIAYRLSGEAKWPAQLHDCKAAIRWLKANAERLNIDPDRIAVWGTSAGGHLSSMLGVTGDAGGYLEGLVGKQTEQDSTVKCVIDWFGPSELLRMNDFRGDINHDAKDSPESRLLGGPIQTLKAIARQASPTSHVTKDDAPVLIMHGDQDKLVPFDQSVRFDKALKAAGVSSTLIRIQGAGHGVFSHPDVSVRIRSFLARHLLDRESIEVSNKTIVLPKPKPKDAA